MNELISVVVTTYNREDALGAVLRALAQQTDGNFEVIIADDGSRGETAQTVQSWKTVAPFKLQHVWHEDRGFRAAEIRNRAVLVSHGTYCIFLDGDCLARPDFIASHRGLAERGWFVTGNRVLMSADLTARVLREGLQPESWHVTAWLRERFAGGINRLPPLFSLPLGPLRKLRAAAWRSARSCNLAVWRDDLNKVDGFDAAYRGWGQRGFRSFGAADACRRAAQGREFCHRRAAPLAPGSRPFGAASQRCVSGTQPPCGARASERRNVLADAGSGRKLREHRHEHLDARQLFRLPHARLVRLADGLAIAAAASLPWSTSATGILVALWLVTMLPTIDVRGCGATSQRRQAACRCCSWPWPCSVYCGRKRPGRPRWAGFRRSSSCS